VQAGNEDIYVIQADGSIVRVTNDLAVDKDPAWSPNGLRLAFTSTRDGNEEIYTINSDGTDARRLTNNTLSDTQPTWSSSNMIAYTHQESASDATTDIFLINPDGTGEDQLTVDSRSASDPNFSPDGTQLVFTRAADNAAGNDDIYRIDTPAGTGLLNMTSSETLEEHDAVFAPDGVRVAFLRGYNPTEIDVYSIAAFTGNERQLVDNTSFASLDWQPLCDTCNTVTTMEVKYKGDSKLSVKGSVRPPHPGQSVVVGLYKKSGKRLSRLSQKTVTLDSSSDFSTTLKRVSSKGKCKVKATFAGDDDHYPSAAATPLFPC
jgi:TolB protein